MPNQYTKFQAASQDPTSRAFTWREWTGKRQKRGRGNKKKDGSSGIDNRIGDDSSSEGSRKSSIGPPSNIPLPPDSLCQYVPSSGLRIDPFSSYLVKPDRQEMAVLDHYFHILAPSGKDNDLVFRPRTYHIDPHINLLLPCVLQDYALFDAMLASCQASIALSSGLSAYDDQFLMLHRGRAMAGLRQKLSSYPDTSAFLSIAMLITCDYLIGDLQAVAGHTRALQRLIAMWGTLPDKTAWEKFVKHGVQAYVFVGYLATGISADDQARSSLDNEVDPFRDLKYHEESQPSETCPGWVKLPSGFLELIVASQVSTQLCAILTAFEEISTVIQPDAIRNLRTLHPIQAALQRFAQHKQATYLERCLAAGLLAYTFQFPRIQIPNMFHDPSMQGMIRLFSVSHVPKSDAERECLVWAAVVTKGFMSARASPLPRTREVFTNLLAREPLLREWTSLEPILRRFFWTPSLLSRWKRGHELLVREDDSSSVFTNSASSVINQPSNLEDDTTRPLTVCPVTGTVPTSASAGASICPFFKDTDPFVAQMAKSVVV